MIFLLDKSTLALPGAGSVVEDKARQCHTARCSELESVKRLHDTCYHQSLHEVLLPTYSRTEY